MLSRILEPLLMVTRNFRVKIILHGIHRELKEVASTYVSSSKLWFLKEIEQTPFQAPFRNRIQPVQVALACSIAYSILLKFMQYRL